MKYLDSNVFIYPVIAAEKTEKKAALAKSVLIKLAEGSLRGYTATLTWDELVWSVRRFIDVKTAIIEGRKFLDFPNLKLLRVDESVIRSAQEIIQKYNIKPRDAIHVGCAIKNGIREMISDDEDFDKIKEIKRVVLEKV